MIAKTNHLGALAAAVGALVAVGLLLLIMVVVEAGPLLLPSLLFTKVWHFRISSLFTRVRRRRILQSSSNRISRKFCSAPAPCGRASYVEYRRLLIRRT